MAIGVVESVGENAPRVFVFSPLEFLIGLHNDGKHANEHDVKRTFGIASGLDGEIQSAADAADRAQERHEPRVKP